MGDTRRGPGTKDPRDLGKTAGGAGRRTDTSEQPSPVTFIGTPARQVAGQILSGDKYCWEIAAELVDMLGTHTALMLSTAIAARVARATGDEL